MVITGTKSFEQSKDAAQKFVQQIAKATKLNIKIDSIQTSNIVANSQLPYEVNLTRVNEDNDLKASIAYDVQFLLNTSVRNFLVLSIKWVTLN
jgi:transcription initiation factor TFIID TATA-box-binding protein